MEQQTVNADLQVLIRWAVQRGTSVLPKSTNPDRIVSNLAVLDWSLSEADMATLSSLDYQERMVAGAFLLSPAGPYRCALPGLLRPDPRRLSVEHPLRCWISRCGDMADAG